MESYDRQRIDEVLPWLYKDKAIDSDTAERIKRYDENSAAPAICTLAKANAFLKYNNDLQLHIHWDDETGLFSVRMDDFTMDYCPEDMDELIGNLEVQEIELGIKEAFFEIVTNNLNK